MSKKPVDQTWHGTNEPPRIPMKKRSTYSPAGLEIVPAKAVGIAPSSRHAAKVIRGPKWSHAGPAMRRTIRLEGVRKCAEPHKLEDLRGSECDDVGIGDLILREV